MQNFSPIPSFTEYLQQANDALLTMVQIETKEALEVVEEIAPLVDVLYIGPFDLGNSIGHPIINGVVQPELKAAIARILKACQDAGIRCGMYASNYEEAAEYALSRPVQSRPHFVPRLELIIWQIRETRVWDDQRGH